MSFKLGVKEIIYEEYKLKYSYGTEVNATFLSAMTSSRSTIGKETGRLSTISQVAPSSLDAAARLRRKLFASLFLSLPFRFQVTEIKFYIHYILI